MRKSQLLRVYPELKELVAEATRSLARLDAERLEELALCCQALGADLAAGRLDRSEVVRQAPEATRERQVLAQVLSATRANLQVVERLRNAGGRGSGYGDRAADAWGRVEAGFGDD